MSQRLDLEQTPNRILSSRKLYLSPTNRVRNFHSQGQVKFYLLPNNKTDPTCKRDTRYYLFPPRYLCCGLGFQDLYPLEPAREHRLLNLLLLNQKTQIILFQLKLKLVPPQKTKVPFQKCLLHQLVLFLLLDEP